MLADHDFFGVRLAGKTLAFVPARSVRLLPSSVPAIAAGLSGRGVVPEVQPLGVPDRGLQAAAGAQPSAPSPAVGAPALPAPPSLAPGRRSRGAAHLASGWSRASRARDARGTPATRRRRAG